MAHAYVTIIAKLKLSDVEAIRSAISKLGNPAIPDIAAKLDHMNCIHFASLHAVAASAGDCGYLVLEFSGDGEEAVLLEKLEREFGSSLRPLFERATGFSSDQRLRDFWLAHSIKPGAAYSDATGLPFTGTPGMTVKRINAECELAAFVSKHLYALPIGHSALDRLNKVRHDLASAPKFEWARNAESVPLLGEERSERRALIQTVFLGAWKYLWPIVFLMIGAGIAVYYLTRSAAHAFVASAAVVVLAAAASAVAIRRLLKLEESDVPEDAPTNAAHLQAVMANENHARQNHLFVHSVLKPGRLRQLALKLVFFSIGELAKRQFKPGFLAQIGTIHFARWIVVPGSRDLLFFSNYGGSWESYLEDFITQAHTGLTGVWSNTLGFPRARWLIQDGATDGDRFKLWARNHQVPTGFWYSAYPMLTTTNIRTNATIRQGLAGAQTEDEARRWLRLFGSAPAPAGALETTEIQSLFYGGFSRLREAEILLVHFDNENPTAAKNWLAAMLPNVTFGDRHPDEQAIVLGLTASGLRRLGLSEKDLATFPGAFLHGMAAPWRSRVLGDVDKNDPSKWWWGQSSARIDGVIISYARDATSARAQIVELVRALNSHGHSVVMQIPMAALPDESNPAAAAKSTEPFGFRDGISQPIVRGTFQAARTPDPLHLVEPGEFLFGYPDNRGYYPPTPSVPAVLDPDEILAAVPPATPLPPGFSTTQVNEPRDLGRNGSFLVIRQLEQDVGGFWASAERAARMVKASDPTLAWITKEWVAAKLLGRWQDGSSLVRNPTYPASKSHRAKSPAPDNSFRFGADDPQGLRCPFGAHIRRANPRDSFNPASQEQLAITNRHRILRRGRTYNSTDGHGAGLLFMCLNADLERQFEFVQQTWVSNRAFHGLADESDCISGSSGASNFTIPTEHGPIHVPGLQTFVTVRGGAYFFMPGKRTLAFLSQTS